MPLGISPSPYGKTKKIGEEIDKSIDRELESAINESVAEAIEDSIGQAMSQGIMDAIEQATGEAIGGNNSFSAFPDHTTYVGRQTADTDIVNKKYIDDKIAALEARIVALGG